jgi:DNA topoisomerase-2
MYAFNHRWAITKYTSAFHMIRDFYGVRLDYYAKRKAFVLGQLQYDADIMANKIRFIKDVIAEKVYIHKIKKTELEEYLETNQYMSFNEVFYHHDLKPRFDLYQKKNNPIQFIEDFFKNII